MPTLCDLTGVKNFPKKYVNKKKESDYFDGISFARTLLGKKNQKKHDFLYWEFNETNQIGVRMGDWKMVVKKGIPFLYNLATDIHEDHNVAAENPDIVKKMVGIIHRQHTEIRIQGNVTCRDVRRFLVRSYIKRHPLSSIQRKDGAFYLMV